MTTVVELPFANTLANNDVLLIVTDPGGVSETTSKTQLSTLRSSIGFANGLSISVNNFLIAGAFTANAAGGTSSNGTPGQYLTSNGDSGVFWSSPGVFSVNTAAQYNWTNTHTFTNTVTIGTSTYFVANGNVGIGTASPASKLEINGNGKFGANLNVAGTLSVNSAINCFGAGGEGGEIQIFNADNSTIGFYVDVSGAADNPRLFSTRDNMQLQIGQLIGSNGVITLHTSATERLRINKDGYITIGSNNTVNGAVTINDGRTYTTSMSYGYISSGGAGTYAGGSQSITVSLYANNRVIAQEVDAFSDGRLKENIVKIDRGKAIDLVKKVDGVNYDWKNVRNDKIKTGFIAQDLVRAGFDNLVTLNPHSHMEEVVDEDGFVSPAGHMFTVNYDQIVPYLSTALRDALDRIEMLEARLIELESSRA